MPDPSVSRLPAQLAEAARAVALGLREGGHRAWIVGGAVRDLWLGRTPDEVDMASEAEPTQVEACFEHTVDVGRAYGTVLVLVAGGEVQHTTFRSDAGYTDARHPEEVHYGHTAEEDAHRRDFTCNALYLDPLDGTLLDPVGGLADLRAGLLRCVGDAHERFGEDALRMMRMARFAAALDFVLDPAARAAAEQHAPEVARVSGERVREELARILEGPRAERGLRLLLETGLLGHVLPGALPGASERLETVAALAAREGRVGLVPGLALLSDTRASPLNGPAGEEARVRALAELEALRPSRAQRRGVTETWELLERTELLVGAPPGSEPPELPRAARLRLVRAEQWGNALALARARARAHGGAVQAIEELAAFADACSPAELHPEPWIRSEHLKLARVPRGPRWGDLLRRAEDLQLEGRLDSAEHARVWLAEELARGGDQDGGNARRSK